MENIHKSSQEHIQQSKQEITQQTQKMGKNIDLIEMGILLQHQKTLLKQATAGMNKIWKNDCVIISFQQRHKNKYSYWTQSPSNMIGRK